MPIANSRVPNSKPSRPALAIFMTTMAVIGVASMPKSGKFHGVRFEPLTGLVKGVLEPFGKVLLTIYPIAMGKVLP